MKCTQLLNDLIFAISAKISSGKISKSHYPLAYDNICQYLAETYPNEFIEWILGIETENARVLRTELNAEPIRADSLILLQAGDRILHLEFQTRPTSEPPLPFRMLQYYVRLQQKYPNCTIEQAVIFLKRSTSEVVRCDRYQSENTIHRYRVIRMWELEPVPFLANPALLPLAPLTQTETPERLLEQIAERVATIEESRLRGNLAACIEVIAGLRFDESLIARLFREELMRESVVYQRILREGREQGLRQGREQGRREERLEIVLRQLQRRLGSLDPEVRQQIQALPLERLDALTDALLDFEQPSDLDNWLSS
jgi:predicted transposase/invertase (TIGR01784 family)